MQSHITIKIIISLAILIVIFLLTLIFPIKFCLKSFPSDNKGDFYVVRYRDLEGAWFLVGDKTGIYDESTVSDYIVYIDGKDLCDIVSGDLYLWERDTNFILYGTATIEEDSYELEGTGTTIVDKRFTIKHTK